ncbi:MAG TPA: 23S rRNA pseudouridine(1911/1915/1917) synthase RluD [Betaproteobacteria bacterium]|nr:23S rRNA pseudouridine(1911/1915/1917) synthase RluD [Betaproteobacteria bacterium]
MAEPEKNLLDYNANAAQLQPFDLVIPPEYAGLRLDQALQKLLPAYSRSRLQDWIRREQVRLDGKAATPKQNVWGGERVAVAPLAHPSELPYAAEAMSLDIIYEDEWLLVINKPPGLVVHPASGHWQGTLLNALLHHCSRLADIPRAGIVHRLDKETSGLLVVAKTLTAQTDLVRQLQARSVRREYLAVVHGVIAREGAVTAPIGRHPRYRTKMAVVAAGKPAVTHYTAVERFAACSLLQCRLETGRTHQIRVHLQSIGHSLVGDSVYGGHTKLSVDGETVVFRRQALHAARLGLTHPASRIEMAWQAETPEDMRRLTAALRGGAR